MEATSYGPFLFWLTLLNFFKHKISFINLLLFSPNDLKFKTFHAFPTRNYQKTHNLPKVFTVNFEHILHFFLLFLLLTLNKYMLAGKLLLIFQCFSKFGSKYLRTLKIIEIIETLGWNTLRNKALVMKICSYCIIWLSRFA